MSHARKQPRNKAHTARQALIRVDQFEERNAPMPLMGMLGMGGVAFGGLGDGLLLSNPTPAAHGPDPAPALVRPLRSNDGDPVKDASSVHLVLGAEPSAGDRASDGARPDTSTAEPSAPAVSPVVGVSPFSLAGEGRFDQEVGGAAKPHLTGGAAPASAIPSATSFQATAPGVTSPRSAPAAAPLSGGPTADVSPGVGPPAEAAVAPSITPAATASSTTAETGSNSAAGVPVAVQTHVVQARLLDTPPQPTPEQVQRVASYAPKRGPELLPPTGSSVNAPASVPTNASHETTGPNDFVFFQNNAASTAGAATPGWAPPTPITPASPTATSGSAANGTGPAPPT